MSHADPGQPAFRTLIERVFREGHRESALTVNVLRTHWQGIVGEELGRRTHPLRLKRDTLWIAAPDACWAYELQFHKRALLSAVQAFLQSEAVREVQFRVEPLPEPDTAADAATPAWPRTPRGGRTLHRVGATEADPAATADTHTDDAPPAPGTSAGTTDERRTRTKRQLERMRRLTHG